MKHRKTLLSIALVLLVAPLVAGAQQLERFCPNFLEVLLVLAFIS